MAFQHGFATKAVQMNQIQQMMSNISKYIKSMEEIENDKIKLLQPFIINKDYNVNGSSEIQLPYEHQPADKRDINEFDLSIKTGNLTVSQEGDVSSTSPRGVDSVQLLPTVNGHFNC